MPVPFWWKVTYAPTSQSKCGICEQQRVFGKEVLKGWRKSFSRGACQTFLLLILWRIGGKFQSRAFSKPGPRQRLANSRAAQPDARYSLDTAYLYHNAQLALPVAEQSKYGKLQKAPLPGLSRLLPENGAGRTCYNCVVYAIHRSSVYIYMKSIRAWHTLIKEYRWRLFCKINHF